LIDEKFTMPRKLLLLTHEFAPFRGGVATFCEKLAIAAARQGVVVTILAPRYGRSGKADRIAPNVSVRYFGGGEFGTWRFPYVVWLTICSLLKYRGAAVFAADWPFVAACGFLNRFARFRYSAMLHGSEILFFRRSRPLNLAMLGNPFFGAAKICTNSRFTAELLFKNYPRIPKALVHIAYLGVDDYWFGKGFQDRHIVLQRLGIPAGRKIVLSVGRLHPRKGQGRCIAALSRLGEHLRKEVVYVVVGPAIDAEYVTELKRAAGKADFPVVLTGAISDEDLRALYGASTVFCLPSQTHDTKVEGFGLVFLEAAGSALPSIATSAGAVPEVVRHAETGLLVAPDDEAALTEALSSILEDEKARNRLGGAAENWAKTFTWAQCAERALAAPDVTLQ
jgi:phosphatidylinositol alpha-1,6-mannosyltransferase